jgi:hypothetical protein
LGSFKSDPTNHKLIINVPIGAKLRVLKLMEKENLRTANEVFLYLLEAYEGNSLDILRRYRNSIQSRIKKGVNRRYIEELSLLKKLLDKYLRSVE